jgi:hypothetical protein
MTFQNPLKSPCSSLQSQLQSFIMNSLILRGSIPRGVTRLVGCKPQNLQFLKPELNFAQSSPSFTRNLRTTANAASSEATVTPPEPQGRNAYERLDSIDPSLHPYLVSEQRPVSITSLWGDNDRMVIAFARSMG